MVQLSHPYMTTGKTTALAIQTFVDKVMTLLFNTLSKFVIAFLLRSKDLFIPWLLSLSKWFWAQERKSVTASFFPIHLPRSDGTKWTMILVFWMLSFKPAFSFYSFTFIKRLFSSSSLSAIIVIPSAYLRLLIFLPAILIPACNSSSLAFLLYIEVN